MGWAGCTAIIGCRSPLAAIAADSPGGMGRETRRELSRPGREIASGIPRVAFVPSVCLLRPDLCRDVPARRTQTQGVSGCRPPTMHFFRPGGAGVPRTSGRGAGQQTLYTQDTIRSESRVSIRKDARKDARRNEPRDGRRRIASPVAAPSSADPGDRAISA